MAFQLQELLSVIGIVGGIVGIAAGVLAIRRHFKPHEAAQILNPKDQAEVGNRKVAVTGVVPRPRRKYDYWVAIQPADASRSANYWWPQQHKLEFESGGGWLLSGATLGRAGQLGEEEDTGKMYTIGLFEVPQSAQQNFRLRCDEGERLAIPAVCRLLHSVDIRRVSYAREGRRAG